jgi:type IV secretory pathway VirB2 component (pilin)
MSSSKLPRAQTSNDDLLLPVLFLASILALIVHPALAQVSGGVDPQSALQSLLTYGMGAAGIAISLICLFKGGHAVAEGRHLLPYIGGAIGGIILAFGGGFLVQHMGIG